MVDNSLAARLFRQLFSRCRCECRSPTSTSLRSTVKRYSSLRAHTRTGQQLFVAGTPRRPQGIHHKPASTNQRRHETTYTRNRGGRKDLASQDWTRRKDVIPADRAAEFAEYETTTAAELSKKNRRPKRMKMLMRDFIEDSLYNPHYGYFSSQAVIFSPGDEPFNFPSFRSEADFYAEYGRRYTAFEDALDEKSPDDSRQLWHTPTELFRPHYAEAIARYMVSNYKLTSYPYHDLIIYELGAGNGTFMLNVLDYIRATDTEVYARTKYKIIEISTSLATLQSSALSRSPHGEEHMSKVEIINTSIFAWDAYIPNPCFVLALEVIDNFAHDVVRYDPRTETPLQGNVLIDEKGEFYPFFSPTLDPIAARYLRVRDAACGDDLPLTHPLRWSRWKRTLRRALPFAPNLSEPEWIPTRAMQFFDILQRYFPAHRLVLADFDTLPESIDVVSGSSTSLNAPVVQTRYKRRMIPVSTPLVQEGYFDILFPTDFGTLNLLYQAISGRFAKVESHEGFMGRWADVEAVRCGNGDVPLLSWYRNQRVLVTV